MRDYRNYSLLQHNTFGIDARCDRFLEFESAEELQKIVLSLTKDDCPLLIIGGGSNLLLTGDFHGTVIHSSIKGTTCLPSDDPSVILLRCGSGETWDDIVELCVTNGWYGAENLSLIPGEVGASAVQNIGAYGVEIKDLIYQIEAIEIATGKHVEFSAADCQYGYRQSRFKQDWRDRYIITYVTYRLSTNFIAHLDYGNIRQTLSEQNIEHPTAWQLRQAIIDIRRNKLPDPEVEGNAGSFFMNPIVGKDKYLELARQYPSMPHYPVDDEHEKIPAGWMIDQCGWKGKSLGRAGVHDKQALVLVNRGGAKGEDIIHLCETIKKDVFDKFGIEIHPEVNIR
jgi:UDP-N-acetylmuramate dehydrogenase